MNSFARVIRNVASLALVFAVAGAAAADLRIVGSDLLGTEFIRELLMTGARHSIKITTALDGSRPGLAELKAGRADLALLVLPPKELAGLENFVAAPVAFHVALIAVPAGCPLTEITLPQVARAFGAEVSPLFAHWEDLGVHGEWSAAPVVPLAPPAGSGVLVEFFRHVALADRELKPTLRRYANQEELASHFAGDTKAIALVATARHCPAGVKLLAVAAAARQPAFLPTAENVRTGDYPLRLPLHVVFPRGRGAELAPCLRFLFGEHGAAVLERAQLMALPASVHAAEIRRLEAL